jgi:hypothetical protein
MRRMRQTTGEKQTFLVQAKSYKIISGSIEVAILGYSLSDEDSIKEVKCSCRVLQSVNLSVKGFG